MVVAVEAEAPRKAIAMLSETKPARTVREIRLINFFVDFQQKL
jgi:hypothetical protein